MPVKVDASTCVGCGACCGVCPTGSLELGADGVCHVNEDTCVDCGACVGTCPTGSLAQ